MVLVRIGSGNQTVFCLNRKHRFIFWVLGGRQANNIAGKTSIHNIDRKSVV